jgi:transketolase
MTANKPLRAVWGETLVEIGRENPDLLVLDGDLANSTRADIFQQAFPDRFLEMGIAEQNMLGVAAGLATMGFIPFISTFAAFATNRALDQIRVVIAQPSLNVKITGAYSGLLTAKTGKTHQEVSDLAVFRAMPHMTVIAPGDANEVAQATRASVAYHGPVYMRLTRDSSPTIFDDHYRFEIGRGVVVREGSDVAIISTGVQTTRCMQACELLEKEGVSAYLLHMPTLKPLDESAILEAARATGAVVTAEDHTVIGGLGGAVAEVLGENLPTRMRRVGIRDVFGESAPNDPLVEKYGLSARHVAQAAKDLLQAKG